MQEFTESKEWQDKTKVNGGGQGHVKLATWERGSTGVILASWLRLQGLNRPSVPVTVKKLQTVGASHWEWKTSLWIWTESKPEFVRTAVI